MLQLIYAPTNSCSSYSMSRRTAGQVNALNCRARIPRSLLRRSLTPDLMRDESFSFKEVHFDIVLSAFKTHAPCDDASERTNKPIDFQFKCNRTTDSLHEELVSRSSGYANQQMDVITNDSPLVDANTPAFGGS